MEFQGIYQDIRVCGNRIYLILMHGEFGDDIRFTGLTLLEETIWDEEWEKRRVGLLPKKHYPMTRLIGWLNSLDRTWRTERE